MDGYILLLYCFVNTGNTSVQLPSNFSKTGFWENFDSTIISFCKNNFQGKIKTISFNTVFSKRIRNNFARKLFFHGLFHLSLLLFVKLKEHFQKRFFFVWALLFFKGTTHPNLEELSVTTIKIYTVCCFRDCNPSNQIYLNSR